MVTYVVNIELLIIFELAERSKDGLTSLDCTDFFQPKLHHRPY